MTRDQIYTELQTNNRQWHSAFRAGRSAFCQALAARRWELVDQLQDSQQCDQPQAAIQQQATARLTFAGISAARQTNLQRLFK